MACGLGLGLDFEFEIDQRSLMSYVGMTEKCLPKKNVRHITFLSG
jgi:hypothetical protein